MRSPIFYIINGMTLYRLIAAPILIVLVILGQRDLFKWLLAVSFLTDAVDGFFARRFKVTSTFGTRLDSIADDSTIITAIVAMCVWNLSFLLQEIIPVSVLFILYAVQNILALFRYRRPTSFHTYTAKAAAVAQAIFLLSFFFVSSPVHWLFYLMFVLTVIDLTEETILVFLLYRYKTNVKGVYWVLKRKKEDKTLAQ